MPARYRQALLSTSFRNAGQSAWFLMDKYFRICVLTFRLLARAALGNFMRERETIMPMGS
jgi:hypothetical protein